MKQIIDDDHKQKVLDALINNGHHLYTCGIHGFFKLRTDVDDHKCPVLSGSIACGKIGKPVHTIRDL